MHDLIFISMEDWDDIWRRNQFLCAGLARRRPEMKILFVGLSRDISHAIRNGRLRAIRRNMSGAVPGLPNITVTQPFKLMPNSISVCRRFNEALVRAHIRRAALRIGIRHPLLWLNPHYAIHMAGRLEESGVIYDVTDDWISLTQAASLRRLIAAQDAELCRRADAVIVCSERLYELKQGLARRLYLIPNGVDSDHYRRVLDAAPTCIERSGEREKHSAGHWERPILGYTGTIHPDRVDVPLLEAIARRLPRGALVLVGPNLLPPWVEARLRAHANVVLYGPVPYRDLPEVMRHFDVCIAPHLVTAFTESLNPIKLWEYLAAGKPIIATNVAGFRDFPQFVRIAHDADDFLCHLQAALCEPPDLAALRRAEAARHSWDARVDSIVEIFREVAG